jgi:hypothetical protein
MQEQTSGDWPLERTLGRTTSAAYFDAATGEWTAMRAALHENIINAMMAGKMTKTTPKLWIVMDGAGTANQH